MLGFMWYKNTSIQTEGSYTLDTFTIKVLLQSIATTLNFIIHYTISQLLFPRGGCFIRHRIFLRLLKYGVCLDFLD